MRLIDPAATERLGAAIAAECPPQACIHLRGELGAGKTTLVRGFLRAMGYHGAVRSPTYTLVEPYQIDAGTFYHLDLYRLADPEELEFIGLRDWADEGVLLIEWPEQAAGVVPAPVIDIALQVVGGEREATLTYFPKR